MFLSLYATDNKKVGYFEISKILIQPWSWRTCVGHPKPTNLFYLTCFLQDLIIVFCIFKLYKLLENICL